MNSYLKGRIGDGLAILEVIRDSDESVYEFIKKLLEELKSGDEKCCCCDKSSALLSKENKPFCPECYEKNIGI